MLYDMKNNLEEELKRGLEATSQLRTLLGQPQVASDETSLTKVTDIINSFDTSISIIQNMVRSMEMNNGSSSSLAKTTPTHKSSRTIETPDLKPDGYIWRKYGKKTISNTKYPKCAYKENQNCKAIKHVQMISDNPTKFQITYFAQHACQPLINLNKTPSINILDSYKEDCTNFTISFESEIATSLNTQNLNDVNLNPSSSLNVNDGLPSSSMTMKLPPPVALASTTTITELVLADEDDVACFKYPEQLYSPTIIPMLSPDDYMSNSILETVDDYNLMMVANNPFDTTDAFLPDLPLWECIQYDVANIL